LHAGNITNPDKSRLTPGRDRGIPYKFPVSIYLIEHEKGLALVDLGYDARHWPDFMKPDADFSEDRRPDRQLLQLGYRPEDIKYVILSHYHIDHCGFMDLFPHPVYIVRREEAKSAWWPADRSHGGGSYCFPDYRMTRDYRYIEIEDDVEYDVFGDGAVVLIDTKGHTRGHQSVVLNLKNTGKIALAVDAASLSENLDERLPPGMNIWDEISGLKAIDRLRALRDEGALVILGHDAEQWKHLKKWPDYYD
jgi:glyoxylase-like metal-dependent hydrolase (beta-lactamase superfamily II)